MPKRSKKPCAKVGCGTLVTNERFCDNHKDFDKNRDYDKNRKSAAQRGYNSKWRKAREQFLSDNPLCLECNTESKLTVATVIDHIIPHKGDYKLFWDKTNWRPLCKRHHDIKTATKDGGFGRKHPPIHKN